MAGEYSFSHFFTEKGILCAFGNLCKIVVGGPDSHFHRYFLRCISTSNRFPFIISKTVLKFAISDFFRIRIEHSVSCYVKSMLKNVYKQVAQGQYVVSDTRCPA